MNKSKKVEPVLSDKPKRVYRKRNVEVKKDDESKQEEKINEIVKQLDEQNPSSVELENSDILVRYPLLNTIEHEELKKKIFELFGINKK